MSKALKHAHQTASAACRHTKAAPSDRQLGLAECGRGCWISGGRLKSALLRPCDFKLELAMHELLQLLRKHHAPPFVPVQEAGHSQCTATASPHLLHEVNVNVIHCPLLDGHLGLGEVSKGELALQLTPTSTQSWETPRSARAGPKLNFPLSTPMEPVRVPGWATILLAGAAQQDSSSC